MKLGRSHVDELIELRNYFGCRLDHYLSLLETGDGRSDVIFGTMLSKGLNSVI